LRALGVGKKGLTKHAIRDERVLWQNVSSAGPPLGKEGTFGGGPQDGATGALQGSPKLVEGKGKPSGQNYWPGIRQWTTPPSGAFNANYINEYFGGEAGG